MRYHIDSVRVADDCIVLNGWAVGAAPETQVQFTVENRQKQPVSFQYTRTRRDDVSQIHFQQTFEKSFGFDLRIPFQDGETYTLTIAADGKKVRLHYNNIKIKRRLTRRRSKIGRLLALLERAAAFLKANGLRGFLAKVRDKLTGRAARNYNFWYQKTRPTAAELEAQKEVSFANRPKFSIVIPVYRPQKRHFTALLDSIAAQTYSQFQVCIADGSPEEDSVSPIVQQYMQQDQRFCYQRLEENRGISENTNAALAMADGDFIVFADHDDALTPDALYECAKWVNEHPACDAFYSDEDKMDLSGKKFFMPHFKPDFNLDLLRSVNYICHLFVVKRSLLEKTGGFRRAFDGAQDYDFIFRCVEQAQQVGHIPKVLYHWRSHAGSTADNPESKLYAFDAGERAIRAHYERTGLPVEKVEKGVDYGIYHTTFKLMEKPLVSVIIPNKDHAADLDVVLQSLFSATYQNVEILVVENNSKEPETFSYYDRVQRAHPNVRVLTWEKAFNYSAINNFGIANAKGDYLLLLNNDVRVITPNFLEEMMGYCQRPDVGIVGARLLYEDDTIQHAGVVIGIGGVAAHVFTGLHRTENSYFHRAMCAQDYSAVTAACLLTKKSVFEQVGGLEESLAVAFNDVDYCLKVRKAGYLVVYTPYAELYHYESKSRGLEDTPEKIARFRREIGIFVKRWPELLKQGDPYYNPNFTLRSQNFELRDLLNEQIGQPFPLVF